MSRSSALLALGVLLLVSSPWTASAHDVPDNVSIRAFLKPAGERMQILVRIPVKALIDVEFPEIPGTGYLDLVHAEPFALKASRLWVSDVLTLYENDAKLPKAAVSKFRLSPDNDPSFGSYESALSHVNRVQLPATTPVLWDRGVLDVLLETPIRSDRSDFSLFARWGRLGIQVVTTVEFLSPDGSIRSYVYEGDPDLYKLNPGPAQAAARFVAVGLSHIAGQADHILFLFCLGLRFRKLRPLIPFVLVFTVAHSLVLVASAYNPAPYMLWVLPVTGTLAAIAVIYMASESILRRAEPGGFWIAAVASGLIFGAGFWLDLEPSLQFGGAHRVVSVLSYNAGLEIGQLLALALVVPAISLFLRFAGAERISTVILAGVIVHMAGHRMAERASVLRSIPIQWAAADAGALSRWLLGIAVAAGLATLAALYLRSSRTMFTAR